MLFSDLKHFKRSNKTFPHFECVEVKNTSAYLLNEFMSAKFDGVEDKEDGLWKIDTGDAGTAGLKRSHVPMYEKFVERYAGAESLSCDLNVLSTFNALKKLKSFSTTEKILLLVHEGKISLAWKDGTSRCEVELGELNMPNYFAFVSVKSWHDAFKGISQANESVRMTFYLGDPLTRVTGKDVDVFLIGKREDRAYF